MPDTHRNDLARVLANIDQCLAKAELIAGDPEHEDHEPALDFLIEFQEARRAVKRSYEKKAELNMQAGPPWVRVAIIAVAVIIAITALVA